MNKILQKIKEFIYKYLIEKEPEMLEEAKDENVNNEDIQKQDENDIFKEYLNVKDYQYILTLQDRYENQEVSEEELSIIEVMNLIDLYKMQLKELKVDLTLKETKLNEIKNKGI